MRYQFEHARSRDRVSGLKSLISRTARFSFMHESRECPKKVPVEKKRFTRGSSLTSLRNRYAQLKRIYREDISSGRRGQKCRKKTDKTNRGWQYTYSELRSFGAHVYVLHAYPRESPAVLLNQSSLSRPIWRQFFLVDEVGYSPFPFNSRPPSPSYKHPIKIPSRASSAEECDFDFSLLMLNSPRRAPLSST